MKNHSRSIWTSPRASEALNASHVETSAIALDIRREQPGPAKDSAQRKDGDDEDRHQGKAHIARYGVVSQGVDIVTGDHIAVKSFIPGRMTEETVLNEAKIGMMAKADLEAIQQAAQAARSLAAEVIIYAGIQYWCSDNFASFHRILSGFQRCQDRNGRRTPVWEELLKEARFYFTLTRFFRPLPCFRI